MKWEYKILAATLNEAALNELGADGWELAGTVAFSGGFQFIFKRPVK